MTSSQTSELVIHGNNLGDELWLRPSKDSDGALEVTADRGDEEVTVTLHPEAVRRLRLALQLFEREGRVRR